VPSSGQFTNWGYNSYQTIFHLEKNHDPGTIIINLQQFIPEEINKRDHYSEASLIPLRKIYFSKFWVFGNYLVFGNIKKTVTLLMVAILVLLTALVNFINISSAQWRERIKQFGIMKVIGANRMRITGEVIAETFIFFLAALIIAIQISSAVSPSVHNYTGISFSDKITGSSGFLLLSIVFVFFSKCHSKHNSCIKNIFFKSD